MNRLFRLAFLATAVSVLAACVLVPVGPRRGYYGPPVVVVPAAVYVRR